MLGSMESVLGDRIDGLSKWLTRTAPHCQREQAHLSAGSLERAYWHYGYLVALRDVQDFVIRKRYMLG